MHLAVLFSFSLFANGLLSTYKKDEQAARLFIWIFLEYLERLHNQALYKCQHLVLQRSFQQ